MSYDDDWPEHTQEHRIDVIRQTIRKATMEELMDLSARNFPVVTDPWCEKFNALLNQHPKASYHIAFTPEEAEIVYCREANAGMWFMPDTGKGMIQQKLLDILAHIVDSL